MVSDFLRLSKLNQNWIFNQFILLTKNYNILLPKTESPQKNCKQQKLVCVRVSHQTLKKKRLQYHIIKANVKQLRLNSYHYLCLYVCVYCPLNMFYAFHHPTNPLMFYFFPSKLKSISFLAWVMLCVYITCTKCHLFVSMQSYISYSNHKIICNCCPFCVIKIQDLFTYDMITL